MIAEKLAPVDGPEDAGPGAVGSEDAGPEQPAIHTEVQTMHAARIKRALIGFILFVLLFRK